ncbi:type II toxin-antitoxin system RelE/ParE family toxin [Thermaerobacter sp. PB12/4term]|uniref:type II toxin-antitoxin system RelE/ParE family toxin n=1 Tax=Thermaerobacter sp. PB12/4term TaxID=2293838 RepID=UPI000E32C820|nr:type II toxin-antitoxin system RelE/ParE family toxin [Thermaerobacter sp. PB12/4term]QIA26718.1 type II toxin-antitoxin system RelE/ParE family toxin [Thermaerobacter sp. PB12/4term]
MNPYEVEAAPRLNRDAKRLPPALKRALDAEIRKIAADPLRGDRKRGVLRDVYVEKFKAQNDQWLIAYRIDENRRVIQLLAFGQHENFYRDLGRYIR